MKLQCATLQLSLIHISSLHPHSAVAMNYFGEYTKHFNDLMDVRIYVKHGEYEKAKGLFGGKLAKYLDDPQQAKALAQALKIAINSVYGLTSASFDNPFRNPKNVNNIVALRGALFMRTLQDEVQQRGFKVAHIKTDSIKIPDATPEIIAYCMDFAKKYGYTFEHEATYERMCLVNNAVYIAKYMTVDRCEALYGYIPGDCKDVYKRQVSDRFGSRVQEELEHNIKAVELESKSTNEQGVEETIKEYKDVAMRHTSPYTCIFDETVDTWQPDNMLNRNYLFLMEQAANKRLRIQGLSLIHI